MGVASGMKETEQENSRIPFIWCPWDHTGSGLSNILDYQTVFKFHSQPSENVHWQAFSFHHKQTKKRQLFQL
jgi:hypothetical protein